MLCLDRKAMVHSPDGNTDHFNVVTEVLQGDRLTPFLFIICLDYKEQISTDLLKESGLTSKTVRNKQYHAKIMTDDANYTNPLVILANKSALKLMLCYIAWI